MPCTYAGFVVNLLQRPPAGAGGRQALPGRVDRLCVRCGYGVAAGRAPDRCPMCGGTAWRERAVAPGSGNQGA
jgi:hypothetical protein